MYNETDQLPEKYRPIGAWGYFGYQLLFSIPLVGFILLIVFSLSNGNINRRNFARSYFCSFILVAIVLIIFGATLIPAILESLEKIQNM
jgi:hypothetical protein